MKAVISASERESRPQPLTGGQPKVTVDGEPILTLYFEELAPLDASEFVVVVGYCKQNTIDHYGDEFDGIPITYAHQREQKRLAYALPTVDDFMLILGHNALDAIRMDGRRVNAIYPRDRDKTGRLTNDDRPELDVAEGATV